jgi:hypothetical protein
MLHLGDMSEERRKDGENQGEGDKESARRYNEHVREFVVYGDVDRAAHDAERAVEGEEAAKLRAAEKIGKAPAHMTRLESVVAIARRVGHMAREYVSELADKLAARRHARAGSR